MRDVLAQIALDRFLGEQAQAPARVALGCIRTGERSDFGALCAINFDWATRARRIVQAGEAIRIVAVTPGGDGGVMGLECGGNLLERLTTVEFEQHSGAFERASRERTG